MEDTIAAVATATGEAAIGIVRMSGGAARRIAQEIFRLGKTNERVQLESHRVYYGTIIDPVTGNPMDEVLLTFMQAPRSYTREDVVEIGCHGGTMPLRRVLRAMLKAGARLAQPGEFTRRAFSHGRIDLAQAEAVCDMIRTQSDEGVTLALQQLEGRLSREINRLRQQLLGTLAAIEATIDFPDEDVEVGAHAALTQDLTQVQERLQKLLSRASEGRVIREGIRTAIVGKPNVGKSSLLNSLLGQERAIVTPVAGTTRDVIEETVVQGGVALVLIDTAGIHLTEDVVEQEGVQRARRALGDAQLLLVVLDDSQGMDADDRALLDMIGSKRAIVLLNKADLGKERVDRDWLQTQLGDTPWLETSARPGAGLEALESLIRQLFLGASYESASRPLVASMRHVDCLERANASLEQALTALKRQEALEMISIDLRESIHALGEITGDSLEADIIDRIFEDFCLGK